MIISFILITSLTEKALILAKRDLTLITIGALRVNHAGYNSIGGSFCLHRIGAAWLSNNPIHEVPESSARASWFLKYTTVQISTKAQREPGCVVPYRQQGGIFMTSFPVFSKFRVCN